MSRSQYPPSPPLSHHTFSPLPSLPPLTSLPEHLKPDNALGKSENDDDVCFIQFWRVLNLRKGPTQAVDPVLLQIPQNAVVICEMFKTSSWQMGNITNGDLENHLKAWLFRLVQWLNIIHFLRTTSQGSTNRA